VYRPKSNRGQNTPAALVVVLHGGGGSGEQVSDNSKSPLSVFNQVAEDKNLIVVYPTATKDNTGKNGWNDCRSDDMSKNRVDDSSFLASLIQEMSGNYGLSRNQAFMSGHSNGAMMSFRMALEHSDLIGAIATSAGNIAKNPIAGACSDGNAPVSAWMLNGAGHPVPSTTVKVRPFVVGKQNRDIEFAREAWDFFESILP
jgi:polyhydroxybutyrate depolymerase